MPSLIVSRTCGALSNTTASWQSIPEISDGDDWASNPLPEGWTVSDMARGRAVFGFGLSIAFLNGSAF